MTTLKYVVTALVVFSAAFFASLSAQPSGPEAQVRQAVQAFYAAFNSPNGFERAADFASEDWNHINPLGGRTNGRTAVLKEVLEVHRTFLKGVSDTVTQIDVRMATPEVGVATVASDLGAYTTPDGVKHKSEHQIRTFVVVKRGARWLIMQDHNTFVAAQPGSSR